MAYQVTDGRVGVQQIADTSTTKNHPLGTVIRAVDPTYGEGEFIYLQGIGSTIVGSIVEYTTSFATGLESTNVAKPNPVAVSMSINVAGPNYGWYQIGGIARMAKNTGTSLAAEAVVRASAGFAVAVATGAAIMGALVAVVASAVSDTAPDLISVIVDRPHGPHDVS